MFKKTEKAKNLSRGQIRPNLTYFLIGSRGPKKTGNSLFLKIFILIFFLANELNEIDGLLEKI